MSVENYCKYNLFGHCKFGDNCRKFHVKSICPNFPCLLEGCASRHPRPCKFFVLYGKCKFDEKCSFLHVSTNDKIAQAEKEIKTLKNEIEALKANWHRVESILGKINHFKKDLEDFRIVLQSDKPAI